MSPGKPFTLHVLPEGDAHYALEVVERRPAPNGHPASRLVVRVRGTPLHCVLDQVLATLKKNGYRPTDLRRDRKVPFHLDEPAGVFLGLLFLAVKPLRKVSRIEAVANGIRRMEPEEAYYWFAKVSRGDEPQRAAKALRVLLARE